MIVKLLTEHHLEFLSLNGGCRGSSESTHVKMAHCWKSHALAHLEFEIQISEHLRMTRLNLFHIVVHTQIVFSSNLGSQERCCVYILQCFH